MNHAFATAAGTSLIETAISWFFHILPFEFGRYFVVALVVFLVTALFAGRLAGRKIRKDAPKARPDGSRIRRVVPHLGDLLDRRHRFHHGIERRDHESL